MTYFIDELGKLIEEETTMENISDLKQYSLERNKQMKIRINSTGEEIILSCTRNEPDYSVLHEAEISTEIFQKLANCELQEGYKGIITISEHKQFSNILVRTEPKEGILFYKRYIERIPKSGKGRLLTII